MKKNIFLLTVISGIAAFFGATRVIAGVSYGVGTYVNLCGSGTVATKYSCNIGCNPSSGSCTSDNGGAVRYICSGKWNQCLESESNWGNYVQLGQVGCGTTVQLSLFDKQCRRSDGSWDVGCSLLGYMVWYSGDCENGVTLLPTGAVVGSKSTVKTTINPTVTPIVVPTNTPILSPVAGVCGNSCVMDSDCKAGTKCTAGECRNAACPGDKTCFCGTIKTASVSAVRRTPETGGSVYWLWLVVVIMLGVGVGLRNMARKIW